MGPKWQRTKVLLDLPLSQNLVLMLKHQQKFTPPSSISKMSDPDIIRGILNSEYWRHLFTGDAKALWILGKATLTLKTEMFASPIKMFLRYDHGKRTLGWIVIIMTGLMMIAFNTTWLVGYLATLFPFSAPFIPIYMTGDQIASALFIDIRSPTLLYIWIGYLGTAIIHLIRIYKGWGRPPSSTSRGTSILYTSLLSRTNIKQVHVQMLVEPGLVTILGSVLIYSGGDIVLGIFFCIAAFCLFCQESYDAINRWRLSG